jgi:oligogalacturonide lyase
MHAGHVPSMITPMSLSSLRLFRFSLRLLALSATLTVIVGLPIPAFPKDPPKSWIDPETGHRVIRLTDEPGSLSFYFNVNAYTPDGRRMAFITADYGIGVIDLTDFKSRVVVPGPVWVVSVCRKTPRVFYQKPQEDALYFTNLDTGATGKLADLPHHGKIATINADETLAAGARILDNEADRLVAGGSREEKSAMMARRLAARLPMEMYTVNLMTGKTNVILRGTNWYNHLQFSPTDPNLLMYCHEGSGWRVDRIWTIRTDGTAKTMIPDEPTKNRILEGELAGHEWWSPDGRTIYVDLHFVKGLVGFVACYNLDTKKHTWYHYEQSEGSVHFNLSPDGKLFCGDGFRPPPRAWKLFGGDGGRAPDGAWIYLFHPVLFPDDQTLGLDLIQVGNFKSEKLCSMSKHDYELEPNVSFTPDQKYVVFRSNMFGSTYVFAVEVEKAAQN